MTREADNPMTGSDFDWMVSNHAVWGWKAPVKASVSGVSFLHLSSFFASIFPLFPRNAWYSGYKMPKLAQILKRLSGSRQVCVSVFFFSDHCIKQIDSMLPCSVIDHRGRQNLVKTTVTRSPTACVPLLCFYDILTSSVIYYWTDARQHGIYLLNILHNSTPLIVYTV